MSTGLNSGLTRTYGLIVYHTSSFGKPEYHISQRRDTLAYIFFLKGYASDDKLVGYFSRMTTTEKKRILENTFENLWIDLFSSDKLLYSEHYKYAFEKFSSLGSRLSEMCAIPDSIELEWGIPKGRKKHTYEPDVVCAQREYKEETYNKCFLEFVDCKPIKCLNTLRNEETVYFIARSKFKVNPKYYTLNIGHISRESVSEETGDLKWLTLTDALRIVSPVYTEVLRETAEVLKKPLSFISLQDVITKYF